MTQLKEATAALEQPAGEETPLESDPQKGQLFDKSQYEREDLQIATVDGQTIDKIRIDLTGSILLDRSDPADVALYNRLILGHECELRVSGKVGGSGAGYTTSKDGELDAVVGKKAVKIDSVWVLTPEEL
ncbi:MAG TPA: hypothetical protein VIL92_06140 [Gaiellaceae bacterium]